MIYRIFGDHQSWIKAEFLLGGALALWGFAVLPPGETFASGTAYRFMTGPEIVWGVIYLALGLLRVFAAVTKRHHLRMVSATLGGAAWAVLAVFFFLGTPNSAIAPVLAFLAVSSGANYLSGLECHVNRRGRCNGLAETELEQVRSKVEQMAIKSGE